MSCLAPYALVRVAELPFESLPAPAAQLRAALDRLDRRERALGGRRDALCARLHGAVPPAPSAGARRRLLAWKRAVYAERLPRDCDLRDLGSLAAALHEWTAMVRARDSAAELAEREFEADLATRRARLRAVWSEPRFQSAVLFASPVLYRDLCRADGDRRTDAAALAYHVRAATKTSPFSRFTAVGQAIVGDGDAGWDEPTTLSIKPIAELNAVVAARLEAALIQSPDFRGRHALVPNPTLTRVDGSVVALRRQRDVATTRIGAADEHFVSANATAPLMRAIELTSAERLTIDELATALAETLGERAESASARAFVERLVEAGFLELDTGLAASEAGALPRLGRSAPRRLRALAEPCGVIGTALAEIADAPPACQDAALSSIRAAVNAVARAVGGDERVDEQGLVFVTGTLAAPLMLDARRLASAERALAELSRAMLAFDAGFVMRRVAHRFFLQTVGAEGRAPLVSFLGRLYQECYRPLFGERTCSPFWEPFDPLVPPGIAPEVELLAEVRASFTDACLRLFEASSGTSVELPPALVQGAADAAATHWPGPVAPSVGFFAQLCATPPDSSYQLAINQIVPGYGTYVARYCDERAYGQLGRSLREAAKARLATAVRGGELAEVVATLGFNGQMHEPLVRRRIPYPGESPVRGDERALDWDRLVIAHWPEGNTLSLLDRADGRRYLPFAPGPLAPHLSPLICRLLTSLGPSLLPDFSLLDLLEARRGGVPEATRVYPEVRLGPLVVLRRTWRVPARLLPEPGTGVAAFRALRRWALELGLPRHVFVTPMRLPDVFRANQPPTRVRRLYKPVWIDFEDPISCELLWRYCGDLSSTLTIMQALPAAERSPLRRADGTHASELFVECWPGGST